MRIRSKLLAGAAVVSVAAFAGLAAAQGTYSWGTPNTTYYYSPSTSPDYSPNGQPYTQYYFIPPAPTAPTLQYQPPELNDHGAAPGLSGEVDPSTQGLGRNYGATAPRYYDDDN